MLDLFQCSLCESKHELLARAGHAARKGASIARVENIGPDERRDRLFRG